MNLSSNCISHQSIRIFEKLGESLLGLIISHRDRYPTHPLMPWKHGTECCEHIFGWMRVISPTFTILDARQMMPKIFSVIKSVMSGHISIPNSENLHAGNDNEIRDLLKITEASAQALATFAGIGNGLSQPLQESVSEQALGEHEDASVSIHKRSKLDYPFDPSKMSAEQALETAARLTSKHQEADVVMSQLTEQLEDLVLEAPINILTEQADPNQLQDPNSNCSSFFKPLVTPEGDLDTTHMASERHAHDSQVENHHGPERPRVVSKDLPDPQYDPDTGHQLLSPSQYSKAVSFYWRSEDNPEYSEARQHRWKTLGKRKPTNLDTVVNVDDLDTQFECVEGLGQIEVEPQDQQLGAGAITAETPITNNKWVVVIKQGYFYLGRVLAIFEHHSGKHAWVPESSSRTKLSYVSLEIYRYSPGQTTIHAAHQPDLPNEWTFSHLAAKFIVYLYSPKGDDSDFIYIEPGLYQVPNVLVNFISTCSAWQSLFLPKKPKKLYQKRAKKAAGNSL
ncbi:uncharacterized protein MELLADRAFT_87499 [Melampsora larici-populina 98AG31]|uniref:Uncharacterized protein n=1 Tax=Melampsora larici-populina (strain 98AG31 / pathotype 3-4-7) TaxID=747676 RepID=F4RNK0_MELLP|nr:uncharacterized protein MELLADRAFT_87499 [Melampsora larici-populina 98AG31]EGG06081.1 hypothetical protein MELLADRAFT_87499 [Melampsora larici-populina 98AG31]